MLRLAFGGLTPRRAGGTVEGGEVFDGNGEVGHLFLLSALFCLRKRVSKAGKRSIMTHLPHNYDGLAWSDPSQTAIFRS